MKYSLTRKILPAFAITTALGLLPIHTVNAQETFPGITHNDSKEEEFKETLKTKDYDEWRKSLTYDEKQIFSLFEFLQLNPLIKEVNGNIDIINSNELDQFDKRKSILALDALLMKKKIDMDIHVYKYLTAEEVGFKPSELSLPYESIINRNAFKNISENFKFGISVGYLDPHLTKKESKFNGPILLDLKLPKGTHIGYLDTNGHILLPRDRGIIITNSSIIVEKGKEKIKVEAELVDKNTVTTKIEAKENTINKHFRTAIENSTSIPEKNKIPVETKFIKIVTNNLNASFAVNKSATLLHIFTKSVPGDLLVKTLEQMNSNAALTITDIPWRKLGGVINQDIQGISDSSFASYNVNSKQIVLNLSTHKQLLYSLQPIGDDDSAPETPIQTLIHEFGHAVDILILNKLSTTSEFEDLYKEEKNNIKIEDYMKKNPQEFFASAFSYLFSPNTHYQERIKKEAPKTVEFIQNELKKKGLLN
ncbi:anthrax toxin lethal factor-related metalloendopeptidase [Bacillus cereus group sp. MYBK59-1]|uniref:anthrax toxin lethal factor-related metalloendopeptidase n=1 Tax=Bacillus cereus group sp. MYBK59-1 TaxID=3450617 RepID=UPI003F79BCB2